MAPCSTSWQTACCLSSTPPIRPFSPRAARRSVTRRWCRRAASRWRLDLSGKMRLSLRGWEAAKILHEATRMQLSPTVSSSAVTPQWRGSAWHSTTQWEHEKRGRSGVHFSQGSRQDEISGRLNALPDPSFLVGKVKYVNKSCTNSHNAKHHQSDVTQIHPQLINMTHGLLTSVCDWLDL